MTTHTVKHTITPMRLSVHVARCGIASRRKADEMIRAGRVRVNGKTIREPFVRVLEGDRVSVDGREIQSRRQVYLALNKPPGYTCTLKDRFASRKVTELIPPSVGRVFPVGRLDRESSGLLLFTNDGGFANRVLHPRYGVEKEYEAVISPAFRSQDVGTIKEGIPDEGEVLRVVSVRIVRTIGSRSCVRLVLKEGRKREIRRIFAALGYRVSSLKRIRIGRILLGRLPPGSFRELTPAEMAVGRASGDGSGGAPPRSAEGTAAPAGPRGTGGPFRQGPRRRSTR